MRDLNREKIQGIKPKANGGPKSLCPSNTTVAMKVVLKTALFIIVAMAAGGGGGFGARYLYNALVTSPKFAIRSIEVSGLKKLDRADILNMAQVHEGENIFRISANEAVRRIASNPWVQGVTVRRQFPDRVIIHVVERQAASMIRRSGIWFLAADGVAFKPVAAGDPFDMPIISGQGNSDAPDDLEEIQRALAVIQLAANSEALPSSRISEVIISPGGRITLLTSGMMERVEMGAGDLKAQWKVLEAVLVEVGRSGMEAVRVDLNYPSGAAVKINTTDSQALLADGGMARAGQE